jgi:site-specific recombinase XerD
MLPAPPAVPAPSGYHQLVVPVIVADAGDDAATRFIEFFTATIRNANTRQAYGRAVGNFFAWMEGAGIGPLPALQPVHVAAWVEDLGRRSAAPTVKQHLAAIRMLFDWLVTGQVIRHNPATSVRGPKHVVRKGKTTVLTPEETRLLLDAIPAGTMAGRRDRALIGLMVYSFARIGAALAMSIEDVFHMHRRLWVRLHEKGGKHHEMPCHHNLEHYLQDYIDAAGIAEDRKGPLFRTVERGTDRLSSRPLPAQNAWDMVRRRARQAGIQTRINNHTFRATGITTYLKNGGQLEKAAHMAAHSSTRTTQLYDRRSDEVSLDEVERIVI